MLEYRTGRPEESEAIIDFINLVFSHDHRPHDFPELLPKLYNARNFRPEHHYLAVEDGRIRACIGSYPADMVICGQRLHTRNLGAVSVHPYARRAGHMRALMDLLLDDMARERTDLSWLGGQRQRYGYWGYEGVDTSVRFRVDRTNLRHCFGSRTPAWEMRELGQEDPALEQAAALHQSQSAYFERPAFYDVVCSWKARPYGFFDANGELMGYCSANEDGARLQELVLRDDSSVDEALLTLMTRVEGVDLAVGSWRPQLLRELYAVCGGYSLGTSEQCRVMRFEPVVRAALALRLQSRPSPDCAFSFEVTDTGEILRVEVKQGVGSVTLQRQADLLLSRREAETLLFAPLSPLMLPVSLPVTAQALLPLPLPSNGPDNV